MIFYTKSCLRVLQRNVYRALKFSAIIFAVLKIWDFFIPTSISLETPEKSREKLLGKPRTGFPARNTTKISEGFVQGIPGGLS